jgi:hypothetical protein
MLIRPIKRQNMMEWRNEVAVVTGGARGIGRATALTRAPAGAHRPLAASFVRFAHDRRFVGLVFVLFVFIIIVIVGISRRCRVARDGDNLVDATRPFLLQASLKLYGI